MKNNRKGFTLIELLVAMGIVAVLTGMAVFNFNQSRVRARDVQRKNDLSQLQKALELYKNDNGVLYPVNLPGVTTVPQDVLSSYIKIEFNDPRMMDGWQNYEYRTVNSGREYYLMACLENVTDQTRTSRTDICSYFSGLEQDNQKVCLCNNDKGVIYTISQP